MRGYRRLLCPRTPRSAEWRFLDSGRGECDALADHRNHRQPSTFVRNARNPDADEAARAGAIIHYEGLRKLFLQILAEHARLYIGSAAGCKWNNNAHRLRRITLRQELRRKRQQCGRNKQTGTTRNLADVHGHLLPFVSKSPLTFAPIMLAYGKASRVLTERGCWPRG